MDGEGVGIDEERGREIKEKATPTGAKGEVPGVQGISSRLINYLCLLRWPFPFFLIRLEGEVADDAAGEDGGVRERERGGSFWGELSSMDSLVGGEGDEVVDDVVLEGEVVREVVVKVLM